jgi:hypothetical protein
MSAKLGKMFQVACAPVFREQAASFALPNTVDCGCWRK